MSAPLKVNIPRGITRHRGGYRVWAKRGRQSRTFTDSKFGGWQAALAAAWRYVRAVDALVAA